MKLAVVDLETYWAADHSLSKMSPIAYCMHPDTELISMALKVDNQPTKVVFGEWKIRELLEKTDLSNHMLVAHNMAGFDAMILAWRLGVKPKAWGCTLSMARPIHSITVGGSLAKLVEHYELGVKDNRALVETKGKHLAAFSAAERAAMEIYNRDDTDQCHALFHKLVKHYNTEELWQIDATIRMLIEPKLALKKSLLESALTEERARKETALHKLALQMDPTLREMCKAMSPEEVLQRAYVAGGLDVAIKTVKSELMSAPKLAAFLEAQGVPVPMKPSPTNPDKMVPALAKTDQEFIDLQEHENDLVATAVRTRLEVKSTILETRLEAFIYAGTVTKGKWPVPLHYCGATTTGRWSGWLYNPQNLPRINHDKPKLSDALRKSLYAPKGHKIIVADLSGIELRVNHFLWKVPSSMELFTKDPAKADLYKAFAARQYNKPVGEVTKPERHVGKQAQLSLGFGSGAKTFKEFARTVGGIILSMADAEIIKNAWRETYPEIVAGWKKCQRALDAIAAGDIVPIDPWGMVRTCEEGLLLPSNRIIRYPNLRKEQNTNGDTEWWYADGRNKSRIYGGKVDENIVQSLARDIIATNAYDIYRETKQRPVLSVHDELVYVVPDEMASDMLDTVLRIMRTPPIWWPKLAVWASGDMGQCYGEVEK